MNEQPGHVSSTLEESRDIDNFTEKLVVWAGAYTILFVGLSHVLISGEHFIAAPYLGVLFLLNCAGSILAAAGLAWGAYRWAWLLGVLIAGGAFVGFIASRTIGLPGFEEAVGQWWNLPGLLTLAFEALFLGLFVLALTPPGRTLTRGAERGREELDQITGASEERLGRIEGEMAGIRSRMSPDLSGLRKHVEPQAVREQVQRSASGYLQGVRNALGSSSGSRRPGPLAALFVLAAVAILITRRTHGRNN